MGELVSEFAFFLIFCGLIIGVIQFLMKFGKKSSNPLQPQQTNQETTAIIITEDKTKAPSDFDLDFEKCQAERASRRQESSRRYSQPLYVFNLKIKEEYSKFPNLDPFRVLDEMAAQRITPDVTTFNTLLDICFTQKRTDEAMKLFEYMKKLKTSLQESGRQSSEVDIVSYNTIIKGLNLQISDKNSDENNSALLKSCDAILMEIRQNNNKANEITFNTIIDACVRAGQMDLAFKYFSDMKNENLIPDNFTYSTLVKGIKFSGGMNKNSMFTNESTRLQKVIEMLEDCKHGGFYKPDEILLNSVIDACIRFKNLKKAREIFNEMSSLGIQASCQTYGIMIRGYGADKSFNEVMKIYSKMVNENILINEITYTNLIDACLKCYQPEQAMAFFKKITSEKDLKISPTFFTTLISSFSNANKFDYAYEVYKYMSSISDMNPNIISYNAMLEGAIKCNNPKFFDIFNDIMKKSDNLFQADLVTYGTYIKGLCKFHKMNEAYNLYIKLRKEKKFTLDDVFFNSILHGLIKARQYDRAMQVHKEMIEDKVKPSIFTYSILIKAYGDQARFEEAMDLFEKAQNSFPPSLIIYTNTIQACIKSKKIYKMLEFYKKMKENNIECDEVLYNIIISGLIFNYHITNAVDILFETIEKGVILNQDVYLNVLKNIYRKMNAKYEEMGDLSQDEYAEMAKKIFEGLDQFNIKFNEEVMKEIQESGLNDGPETHRRSYQSYSSRRSSNSNNNTFRRTIY